MVFTSNSLSGVGAYFGAQCEKNGMLVRIAGDNIMMSPPFIMTPQEVDKVSLIGKWLSFSLSETNIFLTRNLLSVKSYLTYKTTIL